MCPRRRTCTTWFRLYDSFAMEIEIRDAVASDLPAILEIYNELIASTTVAWTERAETLDERRDWFAEKERRVFPTLVAVAGGEVLGFASFGDFRDSTHWPGYRFTAEHSIHVRGDVHRTGVGRRLMAELVERARGRGIHVLVAAIDAENVVSIQFHERQ